MSFTVSPRAADLETRLEAFMAEHVYPNEDRYRREQEENGRWNPVPVVEELKPLARAQGLWNLFLPDEHFGAGLSNFDYAPLCETMGRVPWASEIFNCAAPD